MAEVGAEQRTAYSQEIGLSLPCPPKYGGKTLFCMPSVQSISSYQCTERLRAAVHYTVGCLCEEIGENKQVEFSKQTIAAISETTFRQCENFAKDLERFAKHGKRTTINTDDVKLLARRSKALENFITEKCNELAASNAEQKEKKLITAGKGKKKSDNQGGSRIPENEDTTSN